ncbi:nuclear factor 7, ovary-like isoform X2 [Syngnathoides biaculeatus]|nr:nuclear factor 7, ovary-like isoform X2 [Syngnathoides biaculeatus]
MCLEHDEKLKLYCVTDQQLICIICRDCERHEGHTFKPIKEAAASLKNKLEEGMSKFPGEIRDLERLVNAQREKINGTKLRSCQLLSQISAQFKELHQFLQKREMELKTEVKQQESSDVGRMTEMLILMELELSQTREKQAQAASVLEISNPEKFLKDWVECNSVIFEKPFQLGAKDCKVVESSLYLGPYESHLNFFVWKEMLQVINPREEKLRLKSDNLGLNVSSDGRSLLHGSNIQTLLQKRCVYRSDSYNQISGLGWAQLTNHPNSFYHALCSSVNQFTPGQHYWEIEVGQIGQTGFWEVGVQGHVIKYNDGNLSIQCPNGVTPLNLQNIPQKIGIYLDSSSHKLAFYNATNMTHIHTVSSKTLVSSMSAFLNIQYKNTNIIPFTVSWY